MSRLDCNPLPGVPVVGSCILARASEGVLVGRARIAAALPESQGDPRLPREGMSEPERGSGGPAVPRTPVGRQEASIIRRGPCIHVQDLVAVSQ